MREDILGYPALMAGTTGELIKGTKHALGSASGLHHLVTGPNVQRLHAAYLSHMARGVEPPIFDVKTGAPKNETARRFFLTLADELAMPKLLTRAFLVGLYGRYYAGKIHRKNYDPVAEAKTQRLKASVSPTIADRLADVTKSAAGVASMGAIGSVLVGLGIFLTLKKRG